MLEIRSFRNSDLLDLHSVYLAHYSKFGPPPQVSVAQFEQAILARTFFDPEKLLVAIEHEEVVGWCQYFSDLTPAKIPRNVIAKLCSLGGDRLATPSVDNLTQRLLQTVIDRSNQQSIHPADQLDAGLVRDDRWGYAGLDPTGAAYGISVNDLKLTNLLQKQGFRIGSQHVRMQVSTDRYRMPMSRETMQWRRSGSVVQSQVMPRSVRAAAAMSHLDISEFSLRDRGGQVHAGIEIWTSDPEAEVMRPADAILHQRDPAALVTIDAAEAFLIGSVITELPKHGIMQAEMVLDESSTQAIETLQKLGFTKIDQGIHWVRGS